MIRVVAKKPIIAEGQAYGDCFGMITVFNAPVGSKFYASKRGKYYFIRCGSHFTLRLTETALRKFFELEEEQCTAK